MGYSVVSAVKRRAIYVSPYRILDVLDELSANTLPLIFRQYGYSLKMVAAQLVPRTKGFVGEL